MSAIRRVHILLVSQSNEGKEGVGWYTLEVYGLILAVLEIISAHILLAITQSYGFNQLQRKLENVV